MKEEVKYHMTAGAVLITCKINYKQQRKCTEWKVRIVNVKNGNNIADCDIPGKVQTVPIGYISSCFSEKNGTPRQPTVCGPSRAELRIQRSVFSNPEHPLLGLEHYSHVW